MTDTSELQNLLGAATQMSKSLREVGRDGTWSDSRKATHPICKDAATMIDDLLATISRLTAERDDARRYAGALWACTHSLECCLTEAVRDNPTWARECDHDALRRARALVRDGVGIMAERKFVQDLYIRVCRDSGYQLDYLRAAQFAAKVGGFHPMDVWIAMPSLSTMQHIAHGDHPACHREPRP